jgi:hypothetical protein
MSRSIEIKLGGKSKHFLLTTSALARFEAMTHKQLMAQSTAKNFSMWDLICVVWALLLHENPNLEVRDAANMIDPMNMKPVMNAMQQAIGNYMKEIQR